MIEQINKFREYLDYVERHYNNVHKAWKLINDKCSGKGFAWMDDQYIWNIIDLNIKLHDLSKLSAEEFTQYRRNFFPTQYESKDSVQFKRAWEHHKRTNPHHWQNWTKYYPNSIEYLIENIVDWVAMGFEFNDTAKAYYEKNSDEIDLPDWAVKEMYRIFECIYHE